MELVPFSPDDDTSPDCRELAAQPATHSAPRPALSDELHAEIVHVLADIALRGQRGDETVSFESNFRIRRGSGVRALSTFLQGL
jgi:hypothetical protein